jgi:hypothetical protein
MFSTLHNKYRICLKIMRVIQLLIVQLASESEISKLMSFPRISGSCTRNLVIKIKLKYGATPCRGLQRV